MSKSKHSRGRTSTGGSIPGVTRLDLGRVSKFLVEIVNDTMAPDHQQMRRWAGLRPGEVLDPKEFNAEDVNSALRRLPV